MMYPFSSSDLTCSVAVLKNYMENAPSKVSGHKHPFVFTRGACSARSWRKHSYHLFCNIPCMPGSSFGSRANQRKRVTENWRRSFFVTPS